MIRISLIIATHNRAQQLVEALRSVVRQDLPSGEWECVVVNNNSVDDTGERFAAFAALYPDLNLRMVFEPNPGLSHARNRGLREVSAPLVAIIDDDERINPGFLRAYASFSTRIPGPRWPVAGSSPSILRVVRPGCRTIPSNPLPTRWISDRRCGRFLRGGLRGAAIRHSGVRS